ncbi:MAG: XrtA/PEP-CTERM system histidine kinase PrsK [Gammaproteobacteria bacterium]
MVEFQLISVVIGAASFVALTALILFDQYRSIIGRWLLTASAVSAIWLSLHAAYYLGYAGGVNFFGLAVFEVLRALSWIAVLIALLRRADDRPRFARFVTVTGVLGITALGMIAATALGASPALSKLTLGSSLALSIAGLVFVEQLYRNTDPDRRWSIKYLCLGLGAIFAYDFVLYADGVLFNDINPSLWAGRGAANAVAVPLIAITAARNRDWRVNLFISRQMVFHSAAVLAVGGYLLAIAAAGYYLRLYGGEWGSALRVVFLFAAAILLLSLLSSNTLRSHIRLFLAKHFYRNKYDYGEVWLSFTRRLSQVGADPDELRGTMLRAIADIMDATGGAMWQRSLTGQYAVVAHWELDPARLHEIPEDHALMVALRAGDSLINIALEASRMSVDDRGVIPSWMLELPRAWLVAPIIHGEELLAFVLLCESRSNAPLSWEDKPLLGTLGRQAAGYLALMQATDALADARQFEVFNRLSAFLVHDLKNVVAQLSLVVRNSERHRGNPAFITDAFNTIGDAVAKMNRMLDNLRHTHTGPTEIVVMQEVAATALKHVAMRSPVPAVSAPVAALKVIGNRDRMTAVVEHLLQNAQEATAPHGSIQVNLKQRDTRVVLEIIDSGCGMTQDFIRQRLFKPFDTTKGKAGMGIGVYESLHSVRSMGGRMTVESTPGGGTTFRITLPFVEEADVGAPEPLNFERSA